MITRHSLRQASSRLLTPSVSSRSALLCQSRCAIPLRYNHNGSSQHPSLSAHVRWNSTNKDQPSGLSEKHAPRRPGANLSRLAKKHGAPLTPDEEAFSTGEALEHDIDYDDLYARSKAADLEVQKESGQGRKKKSRHQVLDEEMKQGDSALSSRRSTKNYVISPPSETIYVGNLFFDLAAEDLRAHFEQYGTVLNTTIVHDNRGISKGFGYVQFDTIEEAKLAVEKQHMKVLAGRPVVLQYARSAIQNKTTDLRPTNTLFIGGIPYELTDRDIQDLFSDVHNTVDIRVPVDRRSGVPRGFAHAEFIDVQSAMWGMEVLARKAPYGRKLRVEFTNRKKVGMMHSERLPALWAKRAMEKEVMAEAVEKTTDHSTKSGTSEAADRHAKDSKHE